MKIIVLTVVSALTFCVTGRSISGREDFELWQTRHLRSYSSATEAAFRQRIFAANVQKVAAHNEKGVGYKVNSRPHSHSTCLNPG